MGEGPIPEGFPWVRVKERTQRKRDGDLRLEELLDSRTWSYGCCSPVRWRLMAVPGPLLSYLRSFPLPARGTKKEPRFPVAPSIGLWIGLLPAAARGHADHG
jgi:hypothetical protein